MRVEDVRETVEYKSLSEQERAYVEALWQTRDTIKAVTAAYHTSTLPSARSMVRRLNKRMEIRAVLALTTEGPSRESVLSSLWLLANEGNLSPHDKLLCLELVAQMSGYSKKTQPILFTAPIGAPSHEETSQESETLKGS